MIVLFLLLLVVVEVAVLKTVVGALLRVGLTLVLLHLYDKPCVFFGRALLEAAAPIVNDQDFLLGVNDVVVVEGTVVVDQVRVTRGNLVKPLFCQIQRATTIQEDE